MLEVTRPTRERSARSWAEPTGQAGVPLPTTVQLLRTLLHRQSNIESRIVALHWVVMILVGAGAVFFRSRLLALSVAVA